MTRIESAATIASSVIASSPPAPCADDGTASIDELVGRQFFRLLRGLRPLRAPLRSACRSRQLDTQHVLEARQLLDQMIVGTLRHLDARARGDAAAEDDVLHGLDVDLRLLQRAEHRGEHADAIEV